MEGNLPKPAQRRKNSSWVCVLKDPVSFPCSAFTHPECDLTLGYTHFICNMRTRGSLGKGGEWGRLLWKKHTTNTVDPADVRDVFQKWNTIWVAKRASILAAQWHAVQWALCSAGFSDRLSTGSHKLPWQLDVWAWMKLPRDSLRWKEETIWCSSIKWQGEDPSQAFRLLAFSSHLHELHSLISHLALIDHTLLTPVPLLPPCRSLPPAPIRQVALCLAP